MTTGQIISGYSLVSLLMRRFGLIVIEFLTGLSLFFQIRDGFGMGLGIVTPTPPRLYFKNKFLLFYCILYHK